MWKIVDLGWCVVVMLMIGACVLWIELFARIPVL